MKFSSTSLGLVDIVAARRFDNFLSIEWTVGNGLVDPLAANIDSTGEATG